MIRKVLESAGRLAKEPPFRVLARQLLKLFPVPVATRALWELTDYPPYLMGMLKAAEQARKQGLKAISALEFGVAGGNGLCAMQREALAIERETGVAVRVYGFDRGSQGLPEFGGDYRDHPDIWKPGDYPMDESALRARLDPGTALIIGDIKDTVPRFFQEFDPPPVGFISVDVDLYSSARDALALLSRPDRRLLHRTILYFDDIGFFFNHRYAGELLAIDEFNKSSSQVKIDQWHGVRNGRPFPERPFLEKMYVAHDLQAISEVSLRRSAAGMPLK